MGKELATVEQGGQMAQVVRASETAVGAAAARSKAEIEAAFTIALARPRDRMQVRQGVLAACATSAFADEKSAWYSKPVGGGKPAEGPGIRLAEEYVRCAGNVVARTATVYEDEEKLLVRATAIDLERNTWQEQEIRVSKTVWRRSVYEGQEVIGQKQNARGKTTYLVRADDDALLTKLQAAAMKALRNCIVRLMPRDLIAEAKAKIMETREAQYNRDPDAARKKLIDTFATLRVSAKDLGAYLGHPVEDMTSEEYADLKTVGGSIRSGETTWRAVRAAGQAEEREGQEQEGDGKPGREEGELKLDDLTDEGGASPEAGPSEAEGQEGDQGTPTEPKAGPTKSREERGPESGEGDDGGEPDQDEGATIEIPPQLPLRLDHLSTTQAAVFDAEAARLGLDGMQIDDMETDQQEALYRAIHAQLKAGAK